MNSYCYKSQLIPIFNLMMHYFKHLILPFSFLLLSLTATAEQAQKWQIQGALSALSDKIPEVQIEALRKLDELDALEQIPADEVIHLKKLLKDDNAEVRRRTLEALNKLGKAAKTAIPQIVPLLKDEDLYVRIAAVETLTNLSEVTKASIPEIELLLKHEDTEIRSAAVEALGNLGKAALASFPQMVTLLEDNDKYVRYAAVEALGKLGRTAAEAVPQIEALLKDEASEVRYAAAQALAEMGPAAQKAVPQLKTLLKDESAQVRYSAAEAIGHIGQAAQEALPELVDALKDEDSKVRYAAAEAFAKFDAVPQHIIPDIVALLEHSEAYVQSMAVEALGNLGETAQSALNDIVALLDNEDAYLRAVAVEALGQLGPTAQSAVVQMERLLTDPDLDVRSAAVKALGQLGKAAKPAIPKMITLLHDHELYVRTATIKVLGQLKAVAKPFVPQIEALLSAEQPAYVRAAAIKILGRLGAVAKAAIPDIVQLLTDEDSYVRSAAVEALDHLGQSAKVAVPEIVPLLEHPDSAIRTVAVTTLGNLDRAAKIALPQMIDRLTDANPQVRTATSTALGQLGTIARSALPQVLNLLKDEHSEVRSAAKETLAQLGKPNRTAIPAIVALLEAENPQVRSAAIDILGRLSGTMIMGYIPEIKKRLTDSQADVRFAAIETLGQFGQVAQNAIPQIIERLTDKELYVRFAAVEALGELGTAVKPYIYQIQKLLKSDNLHIRYAAVKALGKLGPIAQQAIPQIEDLLNDKDSDVRFAAVEALGQLGEVAHETMSSVVKLLVEDKELYVRFAVIEALAQLGQGELTHILPIIETLYQEPLQAVELRFLAHFIGGGAQKVKILLKWLGQPRQYPQHLTYEQAKTTLQIFDEIWDLSADFPFLRADLTEKIATVVGFEGIEWQQQDLSLLQRHLAHLQAANSPHTDVLEQLIAQAQTKEWALLAVKALIVHALFWLVLIGIYPRVPKVQQLFFWNGLVRKLLGLGYINLALTQIPALRQRLLKPYQDQLLVYADLAYFNRINYFIEMDTKYEGSIATLPLLSCISDIRGHTLLEGESGVGKTMLLYYLIRHSERVVTYLPSEYCLEGIVTAIQKQLRGVIQDLSFLEKLIRKGAVDICLDNLNQATAETYAILTHFIEREYRGNIILATQPLEWNPPTTVEIYRLQSLHLEQVEAFLFSRYPALPTPLTLTQLEYEQVCRNYLTKVLDSTRATDVLQLTQQVLINPLEATLVAQMLALQEVPQLIRLIEQRYQLVAREYQRLYQKRSFPLTEFSEHIYQLRLQDRLSLKADEFEAEMQCLEKYHLVFSHHTLDSAGKAVKEWYFLHEKIMDFFIVQTFLEEQTVRIFQHRTDPRFRGIFRLLALYLPLDAAMILREELIQYAADTQDHIVSDAFIRQLRARNAIDFVT